MSELAYHLLAGLARSTLYLSLAVVVFTIVLRVGRVQLPGLHRLGWATTILVGWVFWSISIAVPWYEAGPVQQASAPAVPDVGYRPLDPGLMAGAPPPAGKQLAQPPSTDELPPAPQPDASLDRTIWSHWPTAVAAGWLAGLLGCAAYLLWSYIRLVRLLRQRGTAEHRWQQEWRQVLRREGVSASIPLCVTEEFGPALCRLPAGYVLAVPANLWRGLAREQRFAIHAHELAHYQRGDVWKSFALRLLALPHWFNPFSWYALRRFEECGEWACDDAARRSDPEHVTAYAKALVRLGELTHAGRLLTTAARGGGLGVRVRRLLVNKPMKDSKMKKLLVGSVVVGLVLLCAVRLELIAQESGESPADAGEQVARDAALIEQAEAMVEAAKAAYENTIAEYELGSVPLDNVYVWSRRWLDAELTLIAEQWHGDDPRIRASRAEAFRKHLERTEEVHARVAELYHRSAIGGEASRYFGTKFFVAEAKLWVERAGKQPAEEQ